MRILITGKHGQVGYELQRTLAPLGDITAIDVEDVDLLDHDAIRQTIRSVKPNLIVNPAAYTAVDEAEKQPDMARAINAAAPAVMAGEAKRLGAAFIHYSTDYVFDGKKNVPYTEDDEPCPLGVYGQSKIEGDRAVQNSGAPHLILRTSWVYGTRGKNFLLTILKLAAEREQLRIINDQFGAPTWSRMIAQATAALVARLAPGPGGWAQLQQLSGIYNLTAAGHTTWFEFTRSILGEPDASALQSRPIITREVVPIATEDYPLPAPRPRYSVLSNAKLQRSFGLAMPDWRTQLHLAVSVQ